MRWTNRIGLDFDIFLQLVLYSVVREAAEGIYLKNVQFTPSRNGEKDPVISKGISQRFFNYKNFYYNLFHFKMLFYFLYSVSLLNVLFQTRGKNNHYFRFFFSFCIFNLIFKTFLFCINLLELVSIVRIVKNEVFSVF